MESTMGWTMEFVSVLVFFCPFPDLERVSFNTGRVASYIQKAFVEAY